jgi:hypothetical protein
MSWEDDAMSIKEEFAVGRKLMHLDARLPKGNVLVCAGNGDEHSFIVQRLGLSVECPQCGQVALSVDLVADFYTRSMEGSTVLPLPQSRQTTVNGEKCRHSHS